MKYQIISLLCFVVLMKNKGTIYYITIAMVIFSCVKIYMLFASWEVCIAKNCDRGLENAALGRSQTHYRLGRSNHSDPEMLGSAT